MSAEWRQWAEDVAKFGRNVAAAINGDSSAKHEVACALMFGEGCEPNPPAAVEILRGLAARGDAVAATGLGSCYQTGSGVVEDQDAARAWFTKGANGGDVLGSVVLAGLLIDSPPDDTEAIAEGIGWAFRAVDMSEGKTAVELRRWLLGVCLDAGPDLVAKSDAYGRPAVQ